jgi:hypothetical protein
VAAAFSATMEEATNAPDSRSSQVRAHHAVESVADLHVVPAEAKTPLRTTGLQPAVECPGRAVARRPLASPINSWALLHQWLKSGRYRRRYYYSPRNYPLWIFTMEKVLDSGREALDSWNDERPAGPASGDRHGLGIIEECEQRTDGDVTLSSGTSYRSIARLYESGLIAPSRRRPAAADDDPRRNYYRLTDRGRKALQRETPRLDRLVHWARHMRDVPRLA